MQYRKLTTIGAADVFVIESRLGRPVGDEALVEQDHIVEVVFDRTQIVVYDQERLALLR